MCRCTSYRLAWVPESGESIVILVKHVAGFAPRATSDIENNASLAGNVAGLMGITLVAGAGRLFGKGLRFAATHHLF